MTYEQLAKGMVIYNANKEKNPTTKTAYFIINKTSDKVTIISLYDDDREAMWIPNDYWDDTPWENFKDANALKKEVLKLLFEDRVVLKEIAKEWNQ